MNPSTQGPIEITRVAVIGAGPLGRRFTQQLLGSGLRVVLEDVLPSNLRRAADELEGPGLAVAGADLRLVQTVEDAVRDADLAIDFVPDELESKLEILSMMDRMAPPRTIFLTPTETLSIADLASCTYRPGLCFGLSGLSSHRHVAGQGAVTLLYPERAQEDAMDAIRRLLYSLGLEFGLRLDPHPSQLTSR